LTEGKWIPKEEWIKQQRESRKRNTCAFNDYDEVTQSMVDRFWEDDRYAEKLIDINDIRPEWRNAYETAKKNVAMLDYAMSSSYTVYFDKNANLNILINSGASWSAQNHLHHYANKCRDYFKLDTAAWSVIDDNIWEPLFNYNRN